MINSKDPKVRELLMEGNIGLEKENLRITGDGFFAMTPDQFEDNENMTRDFCENQLEINTTIYPSAKEAVKALEELTREAQKVLAKMEEREYLWPFSNPPYIKNERSIPIAQFKGEDYSRTTYREYLADRYGRYVMTYSGIHVNVSFGDNLMQAAFEASDMDDFTDFKNETYLHLAEKAAAYGWILTAISAASPIMDSSFFEKNVYDKVVFNGMGSMRSGELGYWNFFTPYFDYENIEAYADSIQRFVDDEIIGYPSELYYPIRLKPPGKNDHNKLKREGVSHIELRMFDLNPFELAGLDWRDVEFAKLLLIWLASTPREEFDTKAKFQAVKNFKNAAFYDLKNVHIMMPNGGVYHVVKAALKIIDDMKSFYSDFGDDVLEILEYQRNKFDDADNRYAWRVRREFNDDYVKKGIELAKELQEELIKE